MQRIITLNWLILSIASLLTGIYISVFEHFWDGKAYLFILLTVLFGYLYYRAAHK